MFEIGSSLAEARRRQGIELARAESATRIRARYLEALEHERFDVLPQGPYRRSFLREYAEFLGLDGELYAAEFDRRFRVPEPEPLPPPPPRLRPAVTRPVLALAVVALAGIVAGLAVWLSQGSPHKHRAAPPPPATTTQSTTRQTQTTPPLHVTLVPVLALRAARGSCWLSVRLGGRRGRLAYEGTLAPGQTVRFSLRHMLWIRIGAPWNLEASIAHRSITAQLPTRIGDVFATPNGLSATA